MSYREIFNDIRNNTIGCLYLFCGEEEYIKDQALLRLEEKILDDNFRDLNYQVMDGSEVSANDIINACETFPFMGERRLVLVKDYALFKAGGRRPANEEGETKRIIHYLPNIPPTTCLLFFNRGEVDKRRSVVKAVKKNGKVIEFKMLDERELMTWVGNTCKRYGKQIKPAEIQYLVSLTGKKLEEIHNEILKLVDYTGKRPGIERDDIDKVVTRSLEHTIFQLVDTLGARETHRGIQMLHQMLTDGEHPLPILAMIGRQFRILLQAKLLHEKGYSSKAIGEKMGIPSFVVTKSIGQSRNFTNQQLQEALKMCLETDQKIKTGEMRDRLAIEMLIFKIAG